MDYPRTPAPQGSNEPVHGPPPLLVAGGQSTRSPVSHRMSKVPSGSCRPPPTHLWLCLFATARAFDFWTPLEPSSSPEPQRPQGTSFPWPTPSIFRGPGPGANSTCLGQFHPPGPIPPASHRPEGQSSLRTTIGPPHHPISDLLLSGSRPLSKEGRPPQSGPAPHRLGPQPGPAPSHSLKGPRPTKMQPWRRLKAYSVRTSGESHGGHPSKEAPMLSRVGCHPCLPTHLPT